MRLEAIAQANANHVYVGYLISSITHNEITNNTHTEHVDLAMPIYIKTHIRQCINPKLSSGHNLVAWTKPEMKGREGR